MPRILATPNARKAAAPKLYTQSAFMQPNNQNVKIWGLVCIMLIWCLIAMWAAPMTHAAAPRDIPAGCSELVNNGSFNVIDASWNILPSARPAIPVTSVTHTPGGYAMQLGIVDLPNASSISAVEQTINLPPGAGYIVLSFWYYTAYDAAPGAGDLQYVDIYNTFSNQLIARVVNEQSNRRQWVMEDFDLTLFAGDQIRVVFVVNNDGVGGRTAMYVDDVSILACNSTITPSATFTATPTPTSTGTPTPPTATFTWTPTTTSTAFPTATYTPLPTAPPGCSNILYNSSFETNDSWIFGEDPVPPRFVGDVHSGGRAVLMGNPPDSGLANMVTYSSVRQMVNIPLDATDIQLRWWTWRRTQEATLPTTDSWSDRNDVITLSPQLEPMQILVRTRPNEGGWQENAVPLFADYYRGKSFYIYFNTYNDGNGLRTWALLDDVQLLVCFGGMAPPAANIMPYENIASSNSVPVIQPTTSNITSLGIVTTPTLFPTPLPLPATSTPPGGFAPAVVASATIIGLVVTTTPLQGAPPTVAITGPQLAPLGSSQTTVRVAPTAGPSSGFAIITSSGLGALAVMLAVLVLIVLIVWAIIHMLRS